MEAGQIQWILDHPKDLYGVLQVSKDADSAALRRSYYKLTLRLHPDKNPGDEKAAEACRIVIAAYNTLSNPQKRQVYDAYGDEGLHRLEQMGDEMPPVDVMLRAIAAFIAHGVVWWVARRTQCLECVENVFPWATKRADRGSEEEFMEAHRDARAAARRAATKAFVIILVLCALLLLGWQEAQRYFASPVTTDGSPRSPTHVLLRSEHSTAAQQAPVPFSAYWDCLRADSLNATLECHRRERAQDSETTTPSANRVQVVRFSGTEEEGVAAFRAYMADRCTWEQTLRWASRERYQPTATLRHRAPLPTPKSPNTAAVRKYAEKRWRPKFFETFPVEDSTELFAASPLCVRWWGLPAT